MSHATPPPTPDAWVAPPPPSQQKVAEHVRLLGILTWVYAGLEMLGILFGIAYAGIGIYLITNPPAGLATQSQPGGGGMPADFVGWVILGAGVFMIVFTGTMTLLSILSARDLLRHRRRVFCIVVAAMHCLNIPLGAVLGIFTILILCKPEAKALFEQSE